MIMIMISYSINQCTYFNHYCLQIQDYVASIANTRYSWIGLTDQYEEGIYTWVDGTYLNER